MIIIDTNKIVIVKQCQEIINVQKILNILNEKQIFSLDIDLIFLTVIELLLT